MTVGETCALIRTGAKLLVAGTREVLDQLPEGCWIGGTTSYFMTEAGCLQSLDMVFVTELPCEAMRAVCASYDLETISRIAHDAPDHGITFLIAPNFSEVAKQYAENAPDFPDMFIKPIAGWVSGVRHEHIGIERPLVYSGPSAEKYDNRIVAMHVELEPNVAAKIDIVNLFEPGDGPVITFPDVTFKPTKCFVDGIETTFLKHVLGNGLDVRLPLVTNLCGAIINISIASFSEQLGDVALYSPVFPGYEYRFAKPIGDYTSQFVKCLDRELPPVFCCNCIHNYTYCELEGKKLGISGPLTYGEIAYQLLNRTMVYVDFVSQD